MGTYYHGIRGKPIGGLSYRDAGVDIDKGGGLVKAIKTLVRSASRASVVDDIGDFGGYFGLKAGVSPVLRCIEAAGAGTPLNLARTFNCGIVMAAVVAPARLSELTRVFERRDERVFAIRRTVARAGDGPRIETSGESEWRS